MKKKILITGGLGMIGRRLALKLKKSNDLIIVDDLSSGLKPLKKIKLYKCSITNKKKLHQIFLKHKPDIIYHLAATHHIPTCEKKRSFSQNINIIGTEVLLNFAEIFNTSKVIIASSGAVYDWSNKVLVENKSSIMPRDNYSLTKYANEIQLNLWTKRSKGQGIVARIFNTIGYDDPNSHLLPDILKQIKKKNKYNKITLGNLISKRDYIDADDVAIALVKMLNYKKNKFDVFNVCCSKEYSVKQIIQILEKILKINISVTSVKSKKRKIDRLSQLGKNKKLMSLTGWKPKHNLTSTLRKYIFQRNRIN